MAKKIVLKNIRRLVTMNPKMDGLGVIENAAVATDGKKILWIGVERDLPPELKDLNGYDLQGKVVAPGLVDCHTHLVYAGSRQREYLMRSEGMSYWDIAKTGGGILSTVRATREASFDDLCALAEERVRVAGENGITTMEIKTGYGLNKEAELKIAKVIDWLKKNCKINLKSTFLGAHVLPTEFKGKRTKYLSLLIDEILPMLVEKKLVGACDVFVEENAFTFDDAKKICSAAKKLGLDIHLHADQFSDVNGGVLAAELGALSADHLDHLSDEGMRAMAESGVVGVLLPGATFFTSTGKYPPARKMLDAGMRVAISTDYNPGTNPTQNLMLMATMGVSFFKMTLDEAWKAITINAAHALGLGDICGSIEVGKRADLTILDVEDEYCPLYYYGRNFFVHAPRPLLS